MKHKIKQRLSRLHAYIDDNNRYFALAVYTALVLFIGPFTLPVKVVLALGAASLVYAIPAASILVFAVLYTGILLVTDRSTQEAFLLEVYLAVCIYVAVELIHIVLRYVIKRTRSLLEP